MYITPDTDINLLASIDGLATILSVNVFQKKYPNGTVPKRSKDFKKTFICRRGCNTKTFKYTDEFIWEDIHHATEQNMDELVEKLESETKTARKRQTLKRTRGDDDFRAGHVDPDDLDEEVGTPRKKQKTSTVSTPRKPRTPSKLLTPSHKRYAI